MIVTTNGSPEVPRPTLEDDAFAAFIKAWIEEYPDHCEDIPAETGLYEILLRNWRDSMILWQKNLSNSMAGASTSKRI